MGFGNTMDFSTSLVNRGAAESFSGDAQGVDVVLLLLLWLVFHSTNCCCVGKYNQYNKYINLEKNCIKWTKWIHRIQYTKRTKFWELPGLRYISSSSAESRRNWLTLVFSISPIIIINTGAILEMRSCDQIGTWFVEDLWMNLCFSLLCVVCCCACVKWNAEFGDALKETAPRVFYVALRTYTRHKFHSLTQTVPSTISSSRSNAHKITASDDAFNPR